MGRERKAEGSGLKDGGGRTEGLREASTGRSSGRQAAGSCVGWESGESLNKTHHSPLSWQNPCICAVPHARRRPARLLQQHGSESSWRSLRGRVLLCMHPQKAAGAQRLVETNGSGDVDVDQCIWLGEQVSGLAAAEELKGACCKS
jgi:hypothetical protein